jgi:hypothetical protein
VTVPDPSWSWRLGLHAQDLDPDGHDTLGGTPTAVDVSIADAGGYFTAADVEAALQELAKKDLGYTAHGNTGSAETFDALTGWHSATVNADCTFTFTGATSGLVAAMVLELAEAGHVVTWPGSVVWPGGVAPTLSASGTDILTFFSRDGGTTWYGFMAGVGSGGSALTVKDEGSSLDTAVTSIDFVGAGVTATNVAHAVTVTVPAADTTAYGLHAHVAGEQHLSDGSTTTYTLDEAYEPGSVIAWNTTTIARLTVTEVLPDQATVSAAGSSGDKIVFDYAATLA